MLVIELHPSLLRQGGSSIHNVLGLTRAAGYHHFQILDHRSSRDLRLTSIVSEEGDENGDVLCVHDSDAASLTLIRSQVD